MTTRAVTKIGTYTQTNNATTNKKEGRGRNRKVQGEFGEKAEKKEAKLAEAEKKANSGHLHQEESGELEKKKEKQQHKEDKCGRDINVVGGSEKHWRKGNIGGGLQEKTRE